MLRRLLVVMYATLREGLQQPICMLLTLTMLVLTLLQPLVQLHTFGEPGRLVRDGGFGFQLIFGLLIVVFTAGFTLSNELRSGTASATLVKPISRAEFFIGKLFGVLGVLVIYWICSTFAILIAERAAERFIENSRIIGYIRDNQAAFLGMDVPLLSLLIAAILNYFKHMRIGLVFFFTTILLYSALFIYLGFYSYDHFWLGFTSDFATYFDFRILGVAFLLLLLLSCFTTMAVALTTRLKTGGALAICFALFSLGFFIDLILEAGVCGRVIGNVLSLITPNVQSFWLPDALGNGGAISLRYCASATINAILYIILYCVIGTSLLRSKDM